MGYNRAVGRTFMNSVSRVVISLLELLCQRYHLLQVCNPHLLCVSR